MSPGHVGTSPMSMVLTVLSATVTVTSSKSKPFAEKVAVRFAGTLPGLREMPVIS